MNPTFLIGLAGSLILVTGAAWPDKKTAGPPSSSIKNWLFTVGGMVMFFYALAGYLQGGPVFFVFLQTLLIIATLLMMVNAPPFVAIPTITVCGLGLAIWSLLLFSGYSTIIFIFGLCVIGSGYTFRVGTWPRNAALTVGSLLVAVFSFIESNWIFCALNTFFGAFSAYYLIKTLYKKNNNRGKRHRR